MKWISSHIFVIILVLLVSVTSMFVNVGLIHNGCPYSVIVHFIDVSYDFNCERYILDNGTFFMCDV